MVFLLGRLNQIPIFSMICTTKSHVKIVLEQTCALYFKILDIKKTMTKLSFVAKLRD